jgi:hypothetical protein
MFQDRIYVLKRSHLISVCNISHVATFYKSERQTSPSIYDLYILRTHNVMCTFQSLRLMMGDELND